METKKKAAAALFATGYTDDIVARVVFRSPEEIDTWKLEPDFIARVDFFKSVLSRRAGN